MKMTNDLSQAVQGVYSSSREIIKNKQRHLYVNMLDLLTRTTRASGASPNVKLNEDYVKFWYIDVLPLVFDEEKSIQDNAVTALETIQPCLEGIEVENLPEWPVIKTIIVDQYSKKLHEFRQAANTNWYKIWCLLVRILNKDILKGASIINTFLSIVEMGFRSSDYNIRADAFLCWKVLVEIFAKHNEIFAPKRIKLICIPLKSSQSKTLETSVNKFKVWWYFLCQLAPKIDQYLDIYESFLVYCFGPTCKQQSENLNNAITSSSTAGQGKMYAKVNAMSIACLIESMGNSPKETANVLNSMGLERLAYPIITKDLMLKCGQIIVNACFESTIMACDPECNHAKQIQPMWKSFNELLVKSENLDLYYECFKRLDALTKVEEFNIVSELQLAFKKIIDELTSIKRIPFSDDNSVNATKLSEALVQFLETTIHLKVNVYSSTFSNIGEMCSLRGLINSPKYWMVQKNLITFIMSCDKIASHLKVSLWNWISTSLIDYLNHNLFEFRINKNAEILNEWITWPMQANLDEDISFNTEQIMDTWKNLMESASCAEGKWSFTINMTELLRRLYESHGSHSTLITVMGFFIEVIDNDFDASTKPTTTFQLINLVLSNISKGSKGLYTSLIQSLIIYLSKLQDSQIIIAFPELKMLCGTIIEKESTGGFAKNSIDNFKRLLQDKLKSDKAKEMKLLKEIKNLIKYDAQFVIIPTVWSMNPDKLTDHQKEKMKEKRLDIPAMYNDISNSQDSSIKPWTPKKIVIAKSKDSDGEIVIENNIEDRDSPIFTLESTPPEYPPLSSTSVMETDVLNDNNQKETPNDEVTSTTPNEVQQIEENVEGMSENSDNEDENGAKSKNKRKSNKPEKRAKADHVVKRKCRKIVYDESNKILEKLNIKAEKKLLRELKTISIDTVEGNTVVQERFRNRKSINKSQKLNIDQGNKESGKMRNTNDLTKKKDDRKLKRKSSVFDSDKSEESIGQCEDAELVNGNNKVLDDSNEEVIEASQQTSESVLSKKVAARKSLISAANNNNIHPNPINKNLPEKSTMQAQKQQNTSISPQKENSSPNIEETIAETPPVEEIFKSPLSLVIDPITKKSPETTTQESNLEDTEPASVNDTVNAEFLQPFDTISNTSSGNASNKSVQSPISLGQQTLTSSLVTVVNNLGSSMLCEKSQNVSISCVDTQPTTQTTLKMQEAAQENALKQQEIEPIVEEQIVVEKQSGNDLNSSIRSSPECEDAEKKNSEFINSTAHLSPIVNDQIKTPEEGRNSINLDKTPTSPVGRKTIKSGLQLPISPPERKSTNNSESPATRPKYIPPLTGRGAQLINMIRNRRIETTPKPQISTLMTAKTDEKPTEQTNTSCYQTPAVQSNLSPSKKDAMPITTPQSAVTATQAMAAHKDLLVFSKILPSPYASPSASILKRKIHRDSLDDIETPVSKRKRVSFHDPPVSVTKEYVKDTDEQNGEKPSLNRCLLPDRTSTPNISIRNSSLKRKGRADSILEIANYAGEEAQTVRKSPTNAGQISIEMDSLKWNNTSTENCQAGEIDERCLTPSPSMYFANEEAVLKHVLEKYDFDVLFEKYFDDTDKTSTNKSIRTVTNKLCSVMKQDTKLKTNVLEILSEKYPREFLDHAVQENLSFVVCERLNYNSIVEFVCEKSKLNEDCRRTLLDRIQSLLSIDKLSTDAQQLMLLLLKNHRMSSEEIVNCLKIITDRHSENQIMSTES